MRWVFLLPLGEWVVRFGLGLGMAGWRFYCMHGGLTLSSGNRFALLSCELSWLWCLLCLATRAYSA